MEPPFLVRTPAGPRPVTITLHRNPVGLTYLSVSIRFHE